MTSEYLHKVKVIADIFRPYGIRVYLSINFASPMALGYTKTADPLDMKVQLWWKRKPRKSMHLFLISVVFSLKPILRDNQGQATITEAMPMAPICLLMH